MRVVICWISVSGYLVACWRALAKRSGIDVRFVVFPTVATVNAPFRGDLADGLPADLLEEKYLGDVEHVASLVAAHRPQIVVIPGWAIPAFKGLAGHPTLASVKFIMTMDTPRKDSWRQTFARMKIGRFLDRMNRVIVPGERSWQYARQLGFTESQIRRGMYGFDAAAFDATFQRRMANADRWPRQFLFVGRYVEEKGVDILLAAYAEYRKQVSNPWGLTCCGQGPIAAMIGRAEGVINRGFVQPPDQPKVFEEHGAFVIASRYEPWGVAIAEGMSAGMPAICTEACGALVELIRPYWNGIGVASGDVGSLARAMRWMHDHESDLPEMGRRAHAAAEAFSAEAWAERWMQMFEEMI